MSYDGSNRAMSMGRSMNRFTGSRGEMTGMPSGMQTLPYARSDVINAGGYGYDHSREGYSTTVTTKSFSGGLSSALAGGMRGGMEGGMMETEFTNYSMGRGGLSMSKGGSRGDGGGGGGGGGGVYIQPDQRAQFLFSEIQELLTKAERCGVAGEAEVLMDHAIEKNKEMKTCAHELHSMGIPNEQILRNVQKCKERLGSVHKKVRRSSSGGWDEAGRSFNDAILWITQQKRLIETSNWGEDAAAVEQQISMHQKFHSSIQRSSEMDRARDDLAKRGDKGNLHALEQEWDSLQQMSDDRTQQLKDLQQIIEEISKEIMWVNEKEEEELMFDWGDKNLTEYIPQKRESYSKLMSALEVKEKELNIFKAKVDKIVKNNHPASDKIEAYQDTLQTQWSWLLKITKCIDTHLKENAAYLQFFNEANETNSILKKEHEEVSQMSKCVSKNTTLEDLEGLFKALQAKKAKYIENKGQVQHLVSKSKSIVRLKPRNIDDKSDKSSEPILVKALCDFKQDQKVILKDDEAILKDNDQRSKWDVIGPGGLDMLVPSVCLIIPPINPLSVDMANNNERYYESILTIINQLHINMWSLITWQHFRLDHIRIETFTLKMLAQMPTDQIHTIIKDLEAKFEAYIESYHGSQMFSDDDKRDIEEQYQADYNKLTVQVHAYNDKQKADDQKQRLDDEANRLAREARERLEKEAKDAADAAAAAAARDPLGRDNKKRNGGDGPIKPVKGPDLGSSSSSSSSSSSQSLSDLYELRLRLLAIEGRLSQHVHICRGDDGLHECGLTIPQLKTVQNDVDLISSEYLKKKQLIKDLKAGKDKKMNSHLEKELGAFDQRLESLKSCSSAYLKRLHAIKGMLESVAKTEDIVKVCEARLIEKDTTSLVPNEVEEYMSTLETMKAELDQKKNVLASTRKELANVSQWDSQVDGPYRCDILLSKYKEEVDLLSDRWKRIQDQLDTRLMDLKSYEPQLKHYKQTSTSITEWIDVTRKKQDTLQATKIENIPALQEQLNNQKDLNSEIKMKRDTLERVLKDNEACVNSIRDYETDLTSYTSGLDTLRSIPVKRTIVNSPSMNLNLESTQLQTRYMELLTQSGDYHLFLGELLKKMEELKLGNSKIGMLEDQLRQMREDINERNAKNKALQDALDKNKLDLAAAKDQLFAKGNNANKDAQKQLSDLQDEMERLKYALKEEQRNRRLAEERYTQQQAEYESVLGKRQKELEALSWSKVELEKIVANKDMEIEQLRRQLADEAARIKDLQMELSKVRSQYSDEINKLKLSYESQIISSDDARKLASQGNENAGELQLQNDKLMAERISLEEELTRLRMRIIQLEEQKKRADEEANRQRAVITEEGHRRRELESQLDALMKQKDEEISRYREELAEAMKRLQEKIEELAYVTHSLEEETRRRKTIEERQCVLEQTLAQLQAKLTSSETGATKLVECEGELKKLRLELEREIRERSRIEQNMSKLQERKKDLQDVRDGLESQVENLRKAKQEELARSKQIEKELEKTTIALAECQRTIAMLRQSQEQACMSDKKGEEERLRLQKELEKSLRQNKSSDERILQLSTELRDLQQKLLQEQAKVKEANLRNESLQRTLEEKTKALNENSAELQRLKELTESQTKEMLRLDKELRAAQHEKEQLKNSQKGCDDEFSSQISALELKLKASERNNLEFQKLVSELSSEREKLKLETEKIQRQATEMKAQLDSLQSKYDAIVKERDATLLKLKESGKDIHRSQGLEEELNRINMLLASELSNKKRLEEENEKLKKELAYWKEQHDSKEGLIRQYETDRENLEKEKDSLKEEIARLMRQLRELEESYKSKLSAMQKDLQEMNNLIKTLKGELNKYKEETSDPSKLVFDGVRKQVTAKQLLECGVLDKPTLSQLVKGQKTVPGLAKDIKVSLKGTGPIAGVVIQGPKGSAPLFKISFTEAMKENLLSSDIVDLLLDAQAATGHIIDPKTNKKLTVKEACNQGVVDEGDKERLLEVEAAAIGYSGPGTKTPLSVFQAMKKGLVDKETTLRLLQAQDSVGGILDPVLSVFLTKETAMERNLIDDEMYRSLNQRPELYLDPESEEGVTYMSMIKRCKVELDTGLLLFPIPERVDPSKLVFDGVRKQVTAQQLLDCGVLDKPTFNQLLKGEKTVQEVSVDKKVFLKGTGSIAGVAAGPLGKMSLSEAKKQMVMLPDSADLLLEAQAATGHIIDLTNNQKLIVEEACARGVVDNRDRDRLLTAEAAAVGFREPSTGKLLSLFEAMKKGLIDRKIGLRLLQAQESAGGILDPHLSVFLPKDTALKRNLLDEQLCHDLNKKPECYLDPDTECGATYVTLKKKCKAESRTGLILLPVIERLDPSKLMFDGVRKQVSAQQLFDCGVLDKPTLNKLMKKDITVQRVSVDKIVFLKGTGPIAGVEVGPSGKMSFSEAKKQKLMSQDSAYLLLEAQAATGHIIDVKSERKLTVQEACAKGVVDFGDQDKLLAAEAAAVGYKDPSSSEPLSVFEAMKKGLIDRKTGLRLLQAQESAGGILDPNISVFLPKDLAIKRNILDENLRETLSQSPKCYIDPDSEHEVSYGALKERCKEDPSTGVLLGFIILPIKGKEESTHIRRRRRVIIVDPETGKEMTVKEAYDKGFIDKETFLELSEQECEWEEITTTDADGQTSMLQIKDKKSGIQYNITDLVMQGKISKSDLERYHAGKITLDDFADIITKVIPHESLSSTSKQSAFSATKISSSMSKTSSSSGSSSVTSSSTLTQKNSSPTSETSSFKSVVSGRLSPTLAKMTTTKTTIVTGQSSTISSSSSRDSHSSHRSTSSISMNLAPPIETEEEQEPVGAIFDTDTLEKISIVEALDRGLVDSITAQRLLEAQACTGGIINPTNGQRFGIQEAAKQGIIDDDMLNKLKAAQKAYIGFEDVKTRKKMSAAEAVKEKWLPYEAGQRFMEYQFVTGGLYDPETGCRRSIDEAFKMGWLDGSSGQKLQDITHHTKNLTCPKSKLKISYKEALDNCMLEESTGVKMLQASLISSRGISSPYNVSSAPGSTTGSRSGSRRGSRRGSVDLGSPSTTHLSFSSSSNR